MSADEHIEEFRSKGTLNRGILCVGGLENERTFRGSPFNVSMGTATRPRSSLALSTGFPPTPLGFRSRHTRPSGSSSGRLGCRKCDSATQSPGVMALRAPGESRLVPECSWWWRAAPRGGADSTSHVPSGLACGAVVICFGSNLAIREGVASRKRKRSARGKLRPRPRIGRGAGHRPWAARLEAGHGRAQASPPKFQAVEPRQIPRRNVTQSPQKPPTSGLT